MVVVLGWVLLSSNVFILVGLGSCIVEDCFNWSSMKIGFVGLDFVVWSFL